MKIITQLYVKLPKKNNLFLFLLSAWKTLGTPLGPNLFNNLIQSASSFVFKSKLTVVPQMWKLLTEFFFFLIASLDNACKSNLRHSELSALLHVTRKLFVVQNGRALHALLEPDQYLKWEEKKSRSRNFKLCNFSKCNYAVQIGFYPKLCACCYFHALKDISKVWPRLKPRGDSWLA